MRAVLLVVLVCGCPGRSKGGPPADLPDLEPEGRTMPRIIENWSDLQPRLHSVYRGGLATDDTGASCATGLRAVMPLDRTPPEQLCTPTADVIGWHAGGSAAWPAGAADVWIGTTPNGRDERIAVAIPASEGRDRLDDGVGESLALQYRCGQLGMVWGQIPAEDLACSSDDQCQLFSASCFTAVVGVHALRPYQEIFDRWGGTCADPLGGACAPGQAFASCTDGKCVVMHE
jgi:hypothetical protein